MRRICQVVFLLLSFLEGGVWSLRNLSINVPRAVLSGEGQSALLRCSYDLEGAALYSIRWYRDEFEFYRYVPRELPPTMVFPLPGTTVDLTRSDERQVSIVNLNRQLSGVYLCEVSADAPLFHTDIRSAPLTVVDIPPLPPELSVSRVTYAQNDVLEANCSSGRAYPAPNITWAIDGRKIVEVVTRHVPDVDFHQRAVSSRLQLSVQERNARDYGSALLHDGRSPNQPNHKTQRDEPETVRYVMEAPLNGQFTLSCVATIFDVYARASQLIPLKEDNPQPASVTRGDSSSPTVFCLNWLIVAIMYLSLLAEDLL